MTPASAPLEIKATEQDDNILAGRVKLLLIFLQIDRTDGARSCTLRKSKIFLTGGSDFQPQNSGAGAEGKGALVSTYEAGEAVVS